MASVKCEVGRVTKCGLNGSEAGGRSVPVSLPEGQIMRAQVSAKFMSGEVVCRETRKGEGRSSELVCCLVPGNPYMGRDPFEQKLIGRRKERRYTEDEVVGAGMSIADGRKRRERVREDNIVTRNSRKEGKSTENGIEFCSEDRSMVRKTRHE